MPDHDFWVTIRPDCQRGREWQALLGTTLVPVRAPIPHAAILPELGRRLCYTLAHELLDPAQLDRLLAHLAARFGMTRAQAEAELAAHGIPILDEDLIVTVYHSARWLT